MTALINEVLDRKGAYIDTIDPDATVFDAVALMNAEHIGALLVIEQDRPVGIFTERDILQRVIAQSQDPTTTHVGEVMTTMLVTIPARATVADAMVVVTDKHWRHLPVVDGDRVCGIVSIGDLTSWLVRDHQRTIDDLYDFIRT